MPEATVKGIKPTGDLYEDAKLGAEAMGIQLHPALWAPTWEIYVPEKSVIEPDGEGEEEEAEPAKDETPPEEKKPVEVISFSKHRIDKNTMTLLFQILPESSVHTLKFSNNGITPSQLDMLAEFLSADTSKV